MAKNSKKSGGKSKSPKVQVKSNVKREPVTSRVHEPSHFHNRELSWLEFNDRVLHLADDERTPLLERLRFLNIFINNLDEFYMKRVGGLKDQIATKQVSVSIDNLTAGEQLILIRKTVKEQLENFQKIYKKEIIPELEKKEITLLEWTDITDKERKFVKNYFSTEIFPTLTPLAVDFGHPFPFVSNLSLSLGISMHKPNSKERIFARVKIPDQVPAWVHLNPLDQHNFRFVSLTDVIINNLDMLFSGMIIDDATLFRVTRSASWDEDDDDAEDLLELVAEGIKDRRFSPVVRLEFLNKPVSWIREYLTEELEITPDDVYELPSLAYFTSFSEIIDIDQPQLKYEPHAPQVPVDLLDTIDEKTGIFSHIRQNDLLVHHPYESFNQSVEKFIVEAARDPQTVAIKCTLYRTDKNSKIIRSLIEAANLRKQVACVIELKARFDEERNIQWAHELVNAGVHVVHGMVGLKTHSKMALVVRREFDGIVSYAHLGTGNYNAITSRLYTDLSYFTCRKEITSEVQEAFNFLTGFSLKDDYENLLIAPINMKEKFIEMIYDEAALGSKGRIIAKMNQLEDKDIIGALYDASCAGVKIDLCVRGFCCLKAGIKGVSENIRVISILGRFLEHSRIYYFGNGNENPLEGSFYIGSADWMYRNLENRVEVITPIKSVSNRSKLWDILTTEIQDKRLAWEQDKKGIYTLREPENEEEELGSQELLIYKTSLQKKIKLK